MKKFVFFFTFIVLLLSVATVFSQELPDFTQERQRMLPNPADFLEGVGILFDANYKFDGNIYEVYQFPLPADENDFIFSYSIAANLANFEVDMSVVSGYRALLIYNPGKTGIPAMLFTNYQGFVLFMIPSGMNFSLNISDSRSNISTSELPSISTTASEKMSAEDAYLLGKSYYDGNGVGQDYAEAVKWFRIAAEQGLADAQNILGNCYSNGEGVEQDYEEAIKWYRLAADQGFSKSQRNIGICYEMGEGVEQNYTEAAKWYRLASAQGLAEAQYNLGRLYYYGEGVEENAVEAVKWFQLSAGQGDSNAQVMLGICFTLGDGIKQSYTDAYQLFLKSAKQDNELAQYLLGLCYEKGLGIKADFIEAEKWYQKAVNNGDVDTEDDLKRIQNFLLWDAKPIPEGTGSILVKNDVGSLIRKKPSFSAESIKTVFNYERVDIIGCYTMIDNISWVYIKTSSGDEGWIPGSTIIGFDAFLLDYL